MGKAAAPVNCRACEASANERGRADVRRRAAPACSQSARAPEQPQTAKTMLASGVPGSLAARRVSTSSRVVISSPVVKPIRSAAKNVVVLTAPCKAFTRIAVGRACVQSTAGGRGKSRVGRGLGWVGAFRNYLESDVWDQKGSSAKAPRRQEKDRRPGGLRYWRGHTDRRLCEGGDKEGSGHGSQDQTCRQGIGYHSMEYASSAGSGRQSGWCFDACLMRAAAAGGGDSRCAARGGSSRGRAIRPCAGGS